MTPLEIFEAAYEKHFDKILGDNTPRQMEHYHFGLLDRVNVNVEAINAMSHALQTFYYEVKKNRGRVSGEPTGENTIPPALRPRL